MPESFVVLEQPGPLIAQGRAADVFAYGDGLVLRRYRTQHDCLYEAAVMQHVQSHGFPVPDVSWVSGTDLVMERLDGPTMLDDFGKHPWRMVRHARTLGDLLKRLHTIPATPWLTRKHEDASSIVHLDLHPDNVMLTSRGPVVIDWSNAGIGDPDAEVADLWLIMSCAVVPGSAFERALVTIGRSLFVKTFLRRFDLDGVKRRLAVATELRSRDRNMSEVEKERMRALVERFAG